MTNVDDLIKHTQLSTLGVFFDSLTGFIPRCLHRSEKRKPGADTPYACIGVVHSNAEKSLFPQNEVWYNENDRMKVRIYTSNAAQKERML